MSAPQNAAIYARISSDQDGSGKGVQRQIEDCRKLAADRGWTVAEEYIDNDISAYSGKRRPSYERMLVDIADGRRDAVIAYHHDRLTRRPIELEQFTSICVSAGVTSLATVTADIDLGNDDGLFVARILAAVAAKESARKSARMKRGNRQKAEAGIPHISQRAFGFNEDKVAHRESEAAVIREVVARFLAGESARSVATGLNADGVPTVKGGPWKTPTIKRILTNPRIAGLREYDAKREINARTWKVAREPIEVRIHTAGRQLADATQTSALSAWIGLGDVLRGSWSELNLDRQVAIVRAVLDHATAPADPANRSHRPMTFGRPALGPSVHSLQGSARAECWR